NLRLMNRRWREATCLPSRLVKEMAQLTTESEHAWRDFRKNNNFKDFLPYFSRMITLTQETAQIKAQVLDLAPYDALMESYSPGLRMADIDVWFAELSEFLPNAIDQALARQSPLPPSVGVVSVNKQEQLGRALMTRLGFDFTQGRLDTSTHPFCGGFPGDVRITTRYDENSFMESLLGVIHETGHALYEANLPAKWRLQPVGEALGMAVHESQSLFLEMQIARGLAFFQFALPMLREKLGLAETVSAEQLYARAIHVKRSLIRVGADEMTYPLHIILRYELEKALLSGDLPPKDLPGAWNDGMQRLLGVRPTTDTDGCLQDIHWPGGAFGYFPSYTVGALIAAQLREAMELALGSVQGSVDEKVQKGEFSAITGWLSTHVHTQGSHISMQELLMNATGGPLSTHAFQRHIQRRYLSA
ncbi:MAG: carboxypeptidase M32, partial [Rickettsiales bacterium]|nr:carboxypeptidase M32 [Rickettsiales bacterium]